MKKYLLPLITLLLLSGCASAPLASKDQDQHAKTFAVSKSKSNIYVYKLDESATDVVVVNGRQVDYSWGKTFMKLELIPGTYNVSILGGDKNSNIVLNTKPGKNYFVSFMGNNNGLSNSYFISQVDEIAGKKQVINLSMLAFSDRALQALQSIESAVIEQSAQLRQAIIRPNFASPDKISAPRPIAGNRGSYKSPFTSAGGIAPWAQEGRAEMDNGSDLAASAGGVVGQQIANKALDFVPFGLGSVIGRSAGESAGRAATRKAIEPALPTMEVVQASSDLSFNTLDELAVYMYAKNSSHPQYARVLALTQRVYPELQQTYTDAIERASHSRGAKGKLASAESQKEKSPKERLKSLQKLKTDGLISESEYQAKRSKIIEEM